MLPAPKQLMPLDEAWTRLETELLAWRMSHPAAVTNVDSFDALGRVLAEDVVSPVDVPPLDNSAMDGYALRASDLASSPAPDPAASGGVLRLSQRIAAGDVGQALVAGTCARIFTGAPVPAGADTVVMQEQTKTTPDGEICFLNAVMPGQNIRRRGEDIRAGQTVLRRGTRLESAALGVAASVGRDRLTVYQPPRVAVLTTGSELVMPGQPLPPGAIYNSNRHTLRGLVQATGAQHRDLGCVPDHLAATRAALREAANDHDLIVTSGGVSVGEEDHLRQAVMAEGGLTFWALGIKPGKPFVFGWLNRPDGSRAWYMGLPGNPVASYVTFMLLVRPVIGVLAGEGWRLPRPVSLRAGFAWPRPDKRREFLRARIAADGALALHPHQGSGVLSSAAWGDGVVDVPPGQAIQPGDMVRYLSYAELLRPAEAASQPDGDPA